MYQVNLQEIRMNLKPETIAQVQAMLVADPALRAQLQSKADTASVAAAIAVAAAAKGIAISASELTAYMLDVAAKHGEMSDAELAEVAGGMPWPVMSKTCTAKNPWTHHPEPFDINR